MVTTMASYSLMQLEHDRFKCDHALVFLMRAIHVLAPRKMREPKTIALQTPAGYSLAQAYVTGTFWLTNSKRVGSRHEDGYRNRTSRVRTRSGASPGSFDPP